jgi:hypothetical protein
VLALVQHLDEFAVHGENPSVVSDGGECVVDGMQSAWVVLVDLSQGSLSIRK